MAASGDLYALAVEFLGACALAINGGNDGHGHTIPAAPGGPIERFYVSPGAPAFDGEQLSVHVGFVAVADTLPLQPPVQFAHRDVTTGSLNLIPLTCTILRDNVVIEQQGELPIMPDPDEMTAVAQATLGDVWAIFNYVRSARRAGTLFASGAGRTREFAMEPAIPINQMGGVAGWALTCRVQLDGYEAVV